MALSLVQCSNWFFIVIFKPIFVHVLVIQASNTDLRNIITPVKSDQLELLLQKSNYDQDKTRYLVDGFLKRIQYRICWEFARLQEICS